MEPRARFQKYRRLAITDAERTVNNPWVDRWFRLGYAMRGVLYVGLSVLLIQFVIGIDQYTRDQVGALELIRTEPFGIVLLWVIAFGFLGYGIWGLVRAILNPLARGHHASGLFDRFGYASSGISYLVLLAPLAAILVNPTSLHGVDRNLIDQFLFNGFNPWLVGLFGVGWLVTALVEFRFAVTGTFKKDFKMQAMTRRELRWLLRLGRIGFTSRGVVFAVLAVFLFRAALFNDPSQPQGFNGALTVLAQQPYGRLALVVIAVGLIGFGIYSLMCAYWIQTNERPLITVSTQSVKGDPSL